MEETQIETKEDDFESLDRCDNWQRCPYYQVGHIICEHDGVAISRCGQYSDYQDEKEFRWWIVPLGFIVVFIVCIILYLMGIIRE